MWYNIYILIYSNLFYYIVTFELILKLIFENKYQWYYPQYYLLIFT